MDNSRVITMHIAALCNAETTEQELEALGLLHRHLTNLHVSHCDPDFIEKQYLTQSKTVLEEGNPYPYFEVTELKFPEPFTLKDFVHYIFKRRYGWSEVAGTGQTLTVQRISSIGSYSKDESLMKSRLIELLDEFLKWLLCQRFSHELISSLGHTVHLAMSYPVIRKQAFIHILEWFKNACTKFEEELFFESSKSLIILGLTDVWSAIRSACSSRLNAIADQFSIQQLELFYTTLVQICKDEQSSWQAKEGAVMGLNVIVRRFQWVGAEDGLLVSDSSSTEYYVKFGKEALPSIPEFISSTLHDVIFLLLAHPQLSIRENAIKTFSSYLSRCGLQSTMSLFNEVISALSKGASLTTDQVAQLTEMSQVVLSPKFSWMDAYLAEGMLGMFIFLVKTYGGISLQATSASVSATAVSGVYNRSFNLREDATSASTPIAITRRCQSPDSAALSLQRQQQFQMSGSLRDTSLRPRRATIDHLNPVSKPIPVRYFLPNGGTNTAQRSADGMNGINALPLLTAVRRFDESLGETPSESDDSKFQHFEEADPSIEIERRKLLANARKLSFSKLLQNILLQTVECFNSGNWELKRMSQQVFPGLVEVLRWYDMSLLVSYWKNNLSTETSVRSYGASLSFLYSLTHAAKLSSLLNDPPDNWQDLEACKREVRKIVDCMLAELSHYIPIFVEIIKRPTMDKLTVIAVEVLLTSSTFMVSASSVEVSRISEHISASSSDCIKNVTALNNPGARIQKYKPANMPHRILLPASGFLSCNALTSDQLDMTLNNLQKYMLEHIHLLLTEFVRQNQVTGTYTLLPCLIKFLKGQYSSAHTNRSFSDSAIIILDKLSPLITDSAEEKIDLSLRKKVYEVKNDSFYELMLCLTDKNVDKHILHLALDCLASLLQHADSCRYILPLCKAICSQLSSSQDSCSQSRVCADSLEIMSNDIRESAELEPFDDSETDDEEAVLLEVEHQESLALTNSGGTAASGRQSGLSQRSVGETSAGQLSLQSEGDSDWDSWDEQEEETYDKETVFHDFLQKIYEMFQSQGRVDDFHTVLKKLPQSETRLIKSLLKI
ncbi:uncharacterized protein [Watersipora subatra]|uniref:uncharacterized protein n=1 Tax=Watersipora subatra TaxID=2589382 RepID=UPI00355C55CF